MCQQPYLLFSNPPCSFSLFGHMPAMQLLWVHQGPPGSVCRDEGCAWFVCCAWFSYLCRPSHHSITTTGCSRCPVGMLPSSLRWGIGLGCHLGNLSAHLHSTHEHWNGRSSAFRGSPGGSAGNLSATEQTTWLCPVVGLALLAGPSAYGIVQVSFFSSVI